MYQAKKEAEAAAKEAEKGRQHELTRDQVTYDREHQDFSPRSSALPNYGNAPAGLLTQGNAAPGSQHYQNYLEMYRNKEVR